MALLLAGFSRVPAAESPREPVLDALPMVGTGGHGHTYPGATRPFGFVQLSPDTRISGWDGCSGYHESDSSILGFSHTHLSGTGIGDLGDALLMPVVGGTAESVQSAPFSTERFKSGFSHERELAEPGYYRVKLDRYNVTAELTSTERAGMHRYTFPASRHAEVLIDLVHGINNKPVEASLTIESPTLLAALERICP